MKFSGTKYYLLTLLILCFTFLSPLICSQSISINKKLQTKILKGLDETYKFNFKRSERIFDKIIKQYPDNPAGFHFKSIPYLWRFLDSKNDSEKVVFDALSDSVTEKSLVFLETNPDDPFINFILGSAYFYRAMAAVRRESYLDVVWTTKKSFSYLDKSLAVDSSFYDAYLGLGLYNFMVAQTPPALKWAMDITGISGDADTGMKYLKLAGQNGVFAKVAAEFYLSQILSEFYQDYNQANSILTRLNKKYSKNLLFNYSLALLKIKMKDFRKAERILKKIILNKDTSFVQLKSYSNLSMGNIHFYKNEFDTAKYFYTNFLSNSTDNYFKGIAALRLGICYFVSGDTVSSQQYFELSDRGNSDIDDDRFASVTSEKFAENLPDTLQLKFIFIRNLIKSGKYKIAYDSLLSIEDSLLTNVNYIAKKNLLLSDVYFNLDSITQSYNRAIFAAKPDDTEKWIKPFAYYYAARASFAGSDISNAELLIEQAEEYKDYFYENDLNNSLNALKENIKRLKKENP